MVATVIQSYVDPALSVETLKDTFLDGTVGALWTTVVTGDAPVAKEHEGAIFLDTSYTPSSQSILRSAAAYTEGWVSGGLNASHFGINDSSYGTCWLGLYIDANTHLRASLEVYQDSFWYVVSSMQAGQTFELFRKEVAAPFFSPFVRWRDGKVELEGVQAQMPSAACYFEFGVSSSVEGGRTLARVSNYRPRPVITFGSSFVQNLLYSSGNVAKLEVPVRATYDPTTVEVIAPNATLLGTYDYTEEERSIHPRLVIHEI